MKHLESPGNTREIYVGNNNILLDFSENTFSILDLPGYENLGDAECVYTRSVVLKYET